MNPFCLGKWSVWPEVCPTAWGEDRDSSLPKPQYSLHLDHMLNPTCLIHVRKFLGENLPPSSYSCTDCSFHFFHVIEYHTSVNVALQSRGWQQSSVWIKEWILLPELDLGGVRMYFCVMRGPSSLPWATFQHQRYLSSLAKCDANHASYQSMWILISWISFSEETLGLD